MRSLSLLVLLLFAVVVCKAVTPEEMKELVANGAPQRLRSFNWLYLTDDRPLLRDLNFWAMPRQDYLQDWTIVQVNDHEVAIKSHLGHYIGRDNFLSGFSYCVEKQEENWDVFTPVKNTDGSWSFLNVRMIHPEGMAIESNFENKWLSAHAKYDDQRYYVNFEKSNLGCEKWFLEPYTPPAPPKHMEELLTNGGRRRFKSFNWQYLTDDYPDTYVWTLPQRIWSPAQEWTIVQINDNEVAIKSYHRGYYISHGSGHWATQVQVADKWEFFTPVKNADGTWSFKSRWGYWLSGHTKQPKEGEPQRFEANFEHANQACEKWRLELA